MHSALTLAWGRGTRDGSDARDGAFGEGAKRCGGGAGCGTGRTLARPPPESRSLSLRAAVRSACSMRCAPNTANKKAPIVNTTDSTANAMSRRHPLLGVESTEAPREAAFSSVAMPMASSHVSVITCPDKASLHTHAVRFVHSRGAQQGHLPCHAARSAGF